MKLLVLLSSLAAVASTTTRVAIETHRGIPSTWSLAEEPLNPDTLVRITVPTCIAKETYMYSKRDLRV